MRKYTVLRPESNIWRLFRIVYRVRIFAKGAVYADGALSYNRGRLALVRGSGKLHGAELEARDLRGGAALVTAALAVQGESYIDGVHHIARGCADLLGSLRVLGADIERIDLTQENRKMRYKKVKKRRSRQAAKSENGQRYIRRRRRNFTLFYILLALFAVGAGVYLSLTMFFNVEEIMVEGSSRYEDSELIEAAGISMGENLFKVDSERAEDKLLSLFSYIEDVEVRRQFPTRVMIIVTEAEPFAALEEADGYTLVSAKGRVLERALKQMPDGLIQVRGISTVLSTGDDEHRLEVLREIIAYMDENGMDDYNFIDLTDTLDIVMICQNRLRVELGNELELDYKLRFTDEVIKKKIDRIGFMIIDASTPGEVMTKQLTISPWETITSQSPQMVMDDEEE